jgi:hypothetical protein
MTINPILQNLGCELTLGYLDDISMGGELSVVVDDFALLQTQALDLGLQLNKKKCEVIVADNSISLPQVFDEFVRVDQSDSQLLGAPLFGGSSGCWLPVG